MINKPFKQSKCRMKKQKINFDFKKAQDSLKNYDWRTLKKYANPQATEDLNDFLEKMPQNAGNTMLIIAGVVWACAGAIGLFTAVQLQQISEARIELEDAQALKPIVPQIVDRAVSGDKVKEFTERTKEIYPNLELRASGPSIVLTGKTLGAYGQFREAIAHIQNGGAGWRVSIDRLCVGRECDKSPLGAALKINTVSVKKAG